MSRYAVRGVPRSDKNEAPSRVGQDMFIENNQPVIQEQQPQARPRLGPKPSYPVETGAPQNYGLVPSQGPMTPVYEAEQDEDDITQEDEMLSAGNRNLLIMVLAFVVIVLLSATGYYVTPYKNGIPVRISLEDMASAKYIDSAKSNIAAIDKAHKTIVNSVTLYNQKLQGAGQTLQAAREQQAELERLVADMEKTDPPPNFVAFHNTLMAVAKLRIEANRHLISYYTDPTRDHLSELADRLTEFEDAFAQCQEIFARLQRLS